MSKKKKRKKKRKKKNNKKIDLLEVYKGIRKVWIKNPKTKILPNKKIKSRKKIKQDLKRRIQKGDY